MAYGSNQTWADAGLLRERLFNLYELHFDGDHIYLSPHDSKFERKLVIRIAKLTHIERDVIREEIISEVKSLA